MSRLTTPVGPLDHVLGPPDARVTLVEYGDYECPYCGRAHAIVTQVLRRVEGVRYAFRHFPLRRAHPHALAAAEAAEAAAAQNAFWPMHAVLFTHQDALEAEDLLAYAEGLELDLARFAAELKAGMYGPRIQQDFRSGLRSGVNGTPTFFVNGVRLDVAWDEPDTLAAALVQAA